MVNAGEICAPPRAHAALRRSIGCRGSGGVVLGSLMFLLPQINLVHLGGGSIRVDDALLVLMAALYWRKTASYVPAWFTKRVLLVAAASTISFMLAVSFSRVQVLSAALYSLRPFEYMLAIPLGIELGRTVRRPQLERILKAVILLLAVMSILQIGGIPLGVSAFSYGRAAGNVGGPYELAALSAILIFYFLKRAPLWAALAIVPLVLSASRITSFAVLAVFLISGRRFVRLSSRLAVIVVCGALFLLSTTLGAKSTPSSSSDALISRLANTSIVSSANAGCDYAWALPPVQSQSEYFAAGYTQLGYTNIGVGPDVSSQIRFIRWCLLLRGLRSPDLLMFGYGPSFAGAAVDGQFVRYLVEYGIFGLLAWSALWLSCLRNSCDSLRASLSVLLVTAVFIDILVSDRPMVLFWVLMGVEWSTRYRRRQGGIDELGNHEFRPRQSGLSYIGARG